LRTELSVKGAKTVPEMNLEGIKEGLADSGENVALYTIYNCGAI
jgi:hypothetical protein